MPNSDNKPDTTRPCPRGLDDFILAGTVSHRGLSIIPSLPPAGRHRHAWGDGPFAKLVMPPLPNEPGLYAWEREGTVVYIGQTRTPLRERLGPRGYSTISTYNTLARTPGRTNGGQQTNCRINALANHALSRGEAINIWFRVTTPEAAASEEACWMRTHGKPEWNRRMESARP